MIEYHIKCHFDNRYSEFPSKRCSETGSSRADQGSMVWGLCLFPFSRGEIFYQKVPADFIPELDNMPTCKPLSARDCGGEGWGELWRAGNSHGGLPWAVPLPWECWHLNWIGVVLTRKTGMGWGWLPGVTNSVCCVSQSGAWMGTAGRSDHELRKPIQKRAQKQQVAIPDYSHSLCKSKVTFN